MTTDREFYAATVTEAAEKAADQLGISTQDLSYRVLDEGSAGFLGIGARDARIMVETGDAAPQVVPEVPDEVADDDLAMEVPQDEARMMDVAATEPSAPISDPSTLAEVYGDSPGAEQAEATQELLDEIKDLVSSFLDAMGFEAGVEVYDAGGFIAVDVAPDNTALFIGQKGETIDALQYLVNVSAFKERSFFKRIVLDAEGYRQRRVEAIQGMAHRTARKAIRERRTVEMPPMNSSERRIVHLYLSENPNVETESEGTGDSRRVMVLPSS
jgi:spoIIIJ-associated protein